MRVRLLHAVANDPAGAVIEIEDRRAHRLVRNGYAEIVSMPVADPVPGRSALERLSKKAAKRRRDAEVR